LHVSATGSDVIVGNAVQASGSTHVAVAWSGSGSSFTATVLNKGTFTSTYALATNGVNIVGYGVDSTGVDHALVWAADNATVAPVDLGTYGLPSAGVNAMATGIDAKGDIVGTSNGSGFELTSAPEPDSVALALLGGISAVTLGRRARPRRTVERC
jgi:hypothetical protein